MPSPQVRFACQSGCTRCCEQHGFVYLAEADIPRLADFLGMTAVAFERRYVYRTARTIRLRSPRDSQCFFLTSEGCSVHPAKPTQCRAFPFWPELLDSKREWRKTAAWCPGIGAGELVNIEAAQVVAQEVRQAYPNHYDVRTGLSTPDS